MTNHKWFGLMTIFLAAALLVGCTSTNLANIPESSQSDATQIAKPIEDSIVNNESQDNESSQTKEQTVEQAVEPTKVETKGDLQVHFIDVGQGASQLIIGPTGRTVLIDAGNNDQESVVVDYLKKQKISKIDVLVGTHPDADHVGGLDAVIDSFEIGKIYMPKVQANTKTFEDVLLAIQRKGLKVTTAKAGLIVDWESAVSIEMVAPVGQYSDTNEMSAVIHLTYDEVSFLLTGDAGSESEQEIMNSKVDIKSDVLMVGHHGSKSATTQALLDYVKPSYAVIQVGQDNNYGHPTAEVLNRLNDNGIQVYRNDQQGDIVFTSNGKDIIVSHSKNDKDAGAGWSSPQSSSTPPATAEPSVAPQKQQEDNVVYPNCTAVKAAGKAPLHKGDPGYSTKLDRDKDGVACE